MYSSRKVLVFIIMMIIVFASCKRNPYNVGISSIEVDIKITRLEQDLFTLDPGSIVERIPDLKNKYSGFLQLFSYVINTGDINDPQFGDLLTNFCTDRLNNEVYEKTIKVYPELSSLESELENAFRHYRYYFPARTIPRIYSCITGFNNSIITGDSILGIGLDRYLGSDCEYYPRLGIFNYISVRMTPDYVVPDCIYGWATSEWDFRLLGYSVDNVLSEMIHEGKLRYFTRCMLPDLPDELIFGFTENQMKFCHNNEDLMWQYLIENDLIFKTDQLTIHKLVGEAPFTTYFTSESPGRAAVWIGFRIIESYMKENREESLESLMKNANVQEILEKARYNP